MPRETQNSITQWAPTTFGAPDKPERIVARLNEEFAELIEAALLGGDVEKEAADVLVVLYQVAAAYGFDLHDATDNKMTVNRNRPWKVGPGGVGQHV